MNYRRLKTPGATYFFTVVTHLRPPIFREEQNINLLRSVLHEIKVSHPFHIDAFVLLPDHLHCIWTMPPYEHNYSLRWQLIKTLFTKKYHVAQQSFLKSSVDRKLAYPIWQKRFWEHQIRNDLDFANHVDYIHYNPVKHGYVKVVNYWPYSSFHHFVKAGVYTESWGNEEIMKFADNIGKE